MKMTDEPKSLAFYVGAAFGILTLGFLILAFQAWLIGIILGWFNVNLSFWQCFLIVFLLGTIFGSSRKAD